jgi:crotonobetainyl-CoA:carnitine CoA-transferase CaiB-like acyl-CoA transferase
MLSQQPLSSYKVIDLTRVRAGPTAVRQLSDWGADVIKVEMPNDNIDDNETDRSDYQNIQRNKRSIAINLKHADGLEIFMKLLATADIVIESFRPDVKYRLGIDYETLRKSYPQLIYASISGFGQTGPYKNRPGYDQIIQGQLDLFVVVVALDLTECLQFRTYHRHEWLDVRHRSTWSRASPCRYTCC